MVVCVASPITVFLRVKTRFAQTHKFFGYFVFSLDKRFTGMSLRRTCFNSQKRPFLHVFFFKPERVHHINCWGGGGQGGDRLEDCFFQLLQLYAFICFSYMHIVKDFSFDWMIYINLLFRLWPSCMVVLVVYQSPPNCILHVLFVLYRYPRK